MKGHCSMSVFNAAFKMYMHRFSLSLSVCPCADPEVFYGGREEEGIQIALKRGRHLPAREFTGGPMVAQH